MCNHIELTTEQWEALNEALCRMNSAGAALRCLMELFSEAKSPQPPDQLFCVLAPIETEFEAARQAISAVEGIFH